MAKKWRLDIIIMVLYQITLIFSAQLLFVIFLDYMPQTYCTDDNYCYKMRSKCLTDFDEKQKNLCPVNMTDSRRDCIIEHKRLFFYSAQYQYQQDCTGLKGFSLSAATFIGTLLGNILLGILADKYGRRLIYFLSILFGVPSLVLSAVIEDVYAFYVFRVLTGFAVSGTLTVGWTYATEMISPNRRLRLMALANWPNARMIQVGLAYLSQEWKRASYLSAAITLTSLPILWYLPESPIWLEQKDKYEEASNARKRMNKINNDSTNSDNNDEDGNSMDKMAFEKITIGTVFKETSLRTSFIVIVFIYFYVGLLVYITDLNGADMTRNLYFGQFLSGLVLSVAQFIIGMTEPCLTSMGRRVLFLIAQTIAIICYALILVCLYSNWKGSVLYLSAYTVAYASQSLCLEAAYLSLVELMPTDVRATVGSIANCSMKIGTLLATFTTPLKFTYEPALFFINLALAAIGMIVVFIFLEESRDTDLKLAGQTVIGTILNYNEEVTPPSLSPVVTPTQPTPTLEPEKKKKTPPAPPPQLVSERELKIIKMNNLKNKPVVERPKPREEMMKTAKSKETATSSKSPSDSPATPKKVSTTSTSPAAPQEPPMASTQAPTSSKTSATPLGPPRPSTTSSKSPSTPTTSSEPPRPSTISSKSPRPPATPLEPSRPSTTTSKIRATSSKSSKPSTTPLGPSRPSATSSKLPKPSTTSSKSPEPPRPFATSPKPPATSSKENPEEPSLDKTVWEPISVKKERSIIKAPMPRSQNTISKFDNDTDQEQD